MRRARNKGIWFLFYHINLGAKCEMRRDYAYHTYLHGGYVRRLGFGFHGTPFASSCVVAFLLVPMKERGVAIRGLVPLVLCASAAARMPLAGKAAFANHAAIYARSSSSNSSSSSSSSRRGSTRAFATAGRLSLAQTILGRRAAHGRRRCGRSAAGGAVRFSSSPDGDEDSKVGDELDAAVKAAVAALPARPRVAVVGGDW